jgi:hypothetical protein
MHMRISWKITFSDVKCKKKRYRHLLRCMDDENKIDHLVRTSPLPGLHVPPCPKRDKYKMDNKVVNF